MSKVQLRYVAFSSKFERNNTIKCLAPLNVRTNQHRALVSSLLYGLMSLGTAVISDESKPLKPVSEECQHPQHRDFRTTLRWASRELAS